MVDTGSMRDNSGNFIQRGLDSLLERIPQNLGGKKLLSPVMESSSPEQLSMGLNTGRTTNYPDHLNALSKAGRTPFIQVGDLGELQKAASQMRSRYGLEEPSPTPTPQPTPQPTPAAQPRQPVNSFEDLLKMAEPIVRERGFHPSPIMSQMAAEGQRGESRFAKERNNHFGLGAYDYNLDNTWRFDHPLDSLTAVLDLYEKDPRYKKAYENRSDPSRFIQEVKNAGYATDPNYVNTIMNTPEWRMFIEQ
jgi:flagellum-specific peptidoglycan hydrolase FlgJ